MSIETTLNDDVMNTLNERVPEAKVFRFEKPLKRFLLLCSILLGGELIWLFIITPCVPLADVQVKTIDGLSRNTVLNRAGITSRSSYMSVNAKETEALLSHLPLVESARVVKHFPDSIEITLKGRTATAVSLAEIDGVTVPVFFDKNGVIFKIGATGEEAIPDTIPLISGFIFENIRPGTRLPAFLTPLLADIETLKEKTPELLSVISEIHVKRKVYEGFEMVLYPAYNPVKIRLGSDLNEEILRYMLLILDVLQEKGVEPDADGIDFRTGTAAYTLKG
jgi:cell division protein FtsQ